MGGWYAKEINTIDDLKGLKIRISGFGAAVMKAARAVQPQRYTEKSLLTC
jgi:TRAP-type mannitol/chloroaromatic compound transport system substrate-binding protein